jgi:uncharacterized membrane protein
MMKLLELYIGAGGLLILLAIPLILKKIKPNPFYGFRVSQTLKNPDVWYAANQTAGRWLLFSGICIVVGAVGLYRFPGIGLDSYAYACLAVFLVTFLTGLFFSWRVATRKVNG